jgi:hypothetical protein
MSVAQVIKNPLTMIGVFASLVEVAGSIVLPQLSGLNQSIYLRIQRNSENIMSGVKSEEME